MSRRPWVETLEERRVLAVFNPLAAAADGAAGSLRDAIVAANGNAEDDTINLEAGSYDLTIANSAGQENAAAEGDLDLTSGSVVFQGAGSGLTFINQTVVDRVFQILPGVTVTFNDLTILNGQAVDDGTAGAVAPAGDGDGGGILNQGSVNLVGTVLQTNTAAGADPGEGGAGLFNASVATLDGSVVTSNVVTGALGNGGGIFTDTSSTLMVSNSAVDGNSANRAGGGIENNDGSVVIGDSQFVNNTAGINGGGLHVSGTGTTDVDGGLFEGNTAGQEGGGLWNNAGTMTITDTMITGNTANAGNNAGNDQGGGGIFNNGGTLNLNNATITGNEALMNLGNGGGVMTDGGTVNIVAGTISGNEAARAGGGIENFGGTVNLSGGVTVGGANAGDGNTAGINGGGLHVSGTGTTDVDGGLFEGNTAGQEGGGLWNNAGTMTITDTMITGNTANAGNNAGNDQGGGGVFNIGGTLNLNNAAITGNEALVNLGNGGGVMTDGGTVNIVGGTISGNQAARAGGGIENFGGTVSLSGGVTVGGAGAGNTAGINGGGLHVSGTGTTDVDGGLFEGNTAGQEGGGLWNNAGTMTITDTMITGNTANAGNNAGNDQGGGGIFNNGGTLNLNNATITGNEALMNLGNGGGVMTDAGTVNIVAGTISGNEAARAGGGIENFGGTVNLSGGVTVGGANAGDGNTAGINGGGLHVSGTGTTDVDGGLFEGNTAGQEGGGLWNGTGTMTIGGGATIVDNTARSENAAGDQQGGGGVFNNGGTLIIDDASIRANIALDPDAGGTQDDGGGGIFNNAGSVSLLGTLVTDNVATDGLGNGGGILTFGGTLDVIGGTLSGNQAARAGGGIENNAGSVNLTFASVQNNTAGINGGGLHISGSGDVNLLDGDFSDNRADNEGGGLWNSAAGTINLNGTLISGNSAVFGGGVFNDGAAGDITVSDATISGNTASTTGGGLNSEGGLVTIANTLITSNTASGAAANEGGGGIFLRGGTVDLDSVTIEMNTADGAAGSGGGILNLGASVSISESLLRANRAVRAGGGIEDNAGIVINLVDSRIMNNEVGSAPGNGGGIHISGAGTINIDGSTIDGNTAVEGGGIWNSGVGTFTLTNSTISGNVATGSDGGGVFNTSGGSITTDSVTITLNDASTGTGNGVAGGTGGVVLENTIVAQNSHAGVEQNLSGSITSADFNLIGDADDGTLTGLTTNTIFGADALLLPLANNGGPTPTHLPGSSSPAIGFGSTNLLVDQNDFDRPQGSQDDIGAVEVDLNGFVINADRLAAGTAGDGNPDEFRIVNETTDPTGDVIVMINSREAFRAPQATTGLILIRGSADDDTLIVDNSNGLIGANIVFDGDGGPRNNDVASPGGFDVLRLVGDTPVNTTYNPGETVDAGAVFQENNQIVQRVEFFGLEPIQVVAPAGGNNILNVASAPLGVGFPQALQGSNTINFSEGPNSSDPVDPVFAGAATGLITVDGFESLEFANFEVLNIDAGAGSDEINLNSPVMPAELTMLNVTGGDPTAESDTVIVNGTAGADTITVDQITNDGARVSGAQAVEVNVTSTEQLVVNGNGDNDSLTVTGAGTFVHTPSDDLDAGDLQIDSLLAVNYRDLGATGSVTARGTGLSDTLHFLDTATGGITQVNFTAVDAGSFAQSTAFGPHIPVTTTAVENYVIDSGQPGSDDIILNGPANASQSFAVLGQGPSDTLNLVANAGVTDVTVTPGVLLPGLTSISGFGAPTFLVGEIDQIAYTGNGADRLIVNGGDADNQILVERGTGQDQVVTDSLPRITYSGVNNVAINGGGGTDVVEVLASNLAGFAGSFTVNGDGTPSDDVLRIIGTEAIDTVTSNATTVTINGTAITAGANLGELRIVTLGGDDVIGHDGLGGNPAPLALALPGVLKVIEAGAGNDIVNGSNMMDADIFGGIGNDNLVGTPLADRIFGGAGNDTLIGGGGDDFQYGEDGNDVFGNPSLASDGTPDDPGSDKNFGGNGFDNFVWEPGDGPDFNNGGDDGADIFRFFGNAADNTFDLQSGGTPTHFNALFNGVVIDNHGIEDVLVDPLGGTDTVNVNDLFQTEVINVTINVGGGDEQVTVAGRTTDDQLSITATAGAVGLEGLTYDVNITNATTADTLTVNAAEGDDRIDVDAGVETIITSTLNGGDGNDALSGSFNVASGDAGDDVIVGGIGNQTINGGAGEDTMVGGPGNDSFDGGPDFDTILISGTAGDDVIDVFQAAPTTLNHTVNGDAQVDTLVASSVEEALVQAGNGADLIRVNWLDAHGVNAAVDSLRMTVEGGADATSDRLAIVDDAGDDLVLYRKGQADNSGTVQVGPGNTEPLLSVFSGVEHIDFVDESGNAIVNAAGGPQLVVFKHDPFESNDDRFTATYLGSGDTINVDPTIDPGPIANPFGDGQNLPGDSDFYRVVAETTGTLDFQVYFRQVAALASGRPGLPGVGNLDINVRDSAGNIIAGFGANDADDDERVRIPAVEGQTYYLEVLGNGDAINVYNFSVVNDAPPVAYDLEVNDILQVGTVNNAVAATETTFAADIAPANAVLPPTSFDYVGKTVEFTSGANVGRSAVITAFNNGTGQFTVGTGLVDAPAVNDTFVIETTDTGRSQFDDITRDNTPLLTFRLDDDILRLDLGGNAVNAGVAPDEVVPIPFNTEQTLVPTTAGYRVAVFAEGNPQQPGTTPQTPVGYARQLTGTPGVYVFDFGADAIGGSLALTDGSQFISAKVEITDPSATTVTDFGPRSASLEVIVDTGAPAVFFGDPAVVGDGLHPESDSGNPFSASTLADRITNDTTPRFFGRGEANSIIRAYVDRTNDGFTDDDRLIGQTVASPLDGTNQHPFGEWEILSTINMNDPALTNPIAMGGGGLGLDGLRTIFVTSEDPAGNTSAAGLASLQLFLDTQGPQVTGVFVSDQPAFNLFTLKPDTPQPTPRVDSLTISVQDLPARVAGLLYPALSNVPPLPPVVLTGDHSGVIAISNLAYNVTSNGPGIATGEIVLTFSNPLPDDRYTLSLADSIIDPAGNQLDGENNAAEPIGTPFFPTGDNIPGGDFVARFTVDSRPEIATWAQGVVYADINGNFVWDPEGQDNDAVNRDFVFNFGELSDAYFTGNFAQNALPGADGILGTADDVPVAANNATSSGFDKIAAYGAFNGDYQFALDTNDDGVQDFVSSMPAAFQVNAIPVAGNFFNSAADDAAVANGQRPRDEIGAFDGQNWYLDVNGNNQIDANERFSTSLRGIPVVGDFNGDGFDDLATFNNDSGQFQFDLNRDGSVNDTITFGFPGFGEKPVAADFNLDGTDDIGLWVPGQEGQLPKEAGEFHFLLSDRDPFTAVQPAPVTGTGPSAIFDPFSPAPLGNDLQAQFGDDFALPLFGNFDPPVADEGGSATFRGSLSNELDPLDTNVDGNVTALDALVVINALADGDIDQFNNPLRLVASLNGYRLDASQDGAITSFDALRVINGLAELEAAGESEPIVAAAAAANWAAAADNVIADLGNDDDDLIDILAADQEYERVKS